MSASIYSTNAIIIKHQAFAGQQFVLTLKTPEIAQKVIPGQFVHLQCASALLLLRPISIMFVDKQAQTIDLLYKIVGQGTHSLSKQKVGQSLKAVGPVGNGFTLGKKKTVLLLGGGVGMPPILALVQYIKIQFLHYKVIVMLASEAPFPFDLVNNKQDLIHYSAHKTNNLLQQWGINCALSSLQGFDGVYQGYITDLAKYYLDGLSESARSEVEIFACGPTPMLIAVKSLASQYEISAQLSLEEYMACAVGGCAGCTVEVQENADKAMKRVCVDGPIFTASSVFND